MHLFSDYVQPLTIWLNQNPHWALLITFLISFSESLAVIGSIIPGSVTMTAVGILAGSGVMRIDLTLAVAILGAIAGDSISYFLGYAFRNNITQIWPFSRYPSWFDYGKNYFSKHGGKSVFIGRFIGPLRSIIPMIAGMMHMNRLSFLMANISSAILWSVLYVMPGILIGIASSELSTESATRLFTVILLLLLTAWLLTWALKWLLKHMHHFLRNHLHLFWIYLKKNPKMASFFYFFTPHDERQYFPTVALILLFITSLSVSIALIVSTYLNGWITSINIPVFLFFQSLRTFYFDSFFIAINLFAQPLTILILIFSMIVYTIFHHDWKTLKYWLSLCFTCVVINSLLALMIPFPTGPISLNPQSDIYYPDINLTIITTLFSFLLFYINSHYRTAVAFSIRIVLVLLLCLNGLGPIYVGTNWLTNIMSSYAIAFTICLSHWILYRRFNHASYRSQIPLVFVFLMLLLSATYLAFCCYKTMVQAHQPYLKQYVINYETWWNQQESMLPIYATNRVGKNSSILNIQYAGSIQQLKHELKAIGWEEQTRSFFYTLLLHLGGNNHPKIPMVSELYHNKKPTLIMVYCAKEQGVLWVIRLWRSNYHLRTYQEPIWLGSIHPIQPKKNQLLMQSLQNHASKELFKFLLPAVKDMKTRFISIPKNKLKSLSYPISPTILMISIYQKQLLQIDKFHDINEL